VVEVGDGHDIKVTPTRHFRSTEGRFASRGSPPPLCSIIRRGSGPHAPQRDGRLASVPWESAGAGSVEALGLATKAGTGCGYCKGELTQLVTLYREEDRTAPAGGRELD